MGFTRDKLIGSGTYGVIHSGEIEYIDGRKERGASKQIFRTNNISGIGILREIQILQTCSSRCIHIPKILGVFFEDYTRKDIGTNEKKRESATFVTELLEFDGSAIFGMKNYDINTMVDMTSQLISGVSYMHSKVITHRDLKPSNILISFDPVTNKPLLKLCDFGFSQFLINSAYSTPGTNSPWYRAPEICWGIPKYGAASDVWAVGATIFEMLTGKVFTESASIDNSELFREIVNRNPNKWTEEIHSLYLRSTDYIIKVSGSIVPISLPSGTPLMDRFKESRYYKENDHHIWVKFEEMLNKCFNYNYGRRISCWELLHDSLFDPVKDQTKVIIDEIKKDRVNEIIEFNIPDDVNLKKVAFFERFIQRSPRFALRQLFHAVDLTNKILDHPEFKMERANVEKICAFSTYFFHKFFATLTIPEDVRNFFNEIKSLGDLTNSANFGKLDEWIYNFELKIIRVLFSNFKIYRSGLFEMPDDYGQTLSTSQMRTIFLEFIKVNSWKNNTYRYMYRQLYNKCIDSTYIFKLKTNGR